ncbi:MAG TPA: PorP/SprF family type IX secretion system membrane protein [Prolixibacteraceae bacterium]|nr:PorP/SprF family type IX secretion system membrane protein [Prolixibacteraceae bacterium]
MKKAVLILLVSLLGMSGYSQSSIRLNDYWENTYYINPSSYYSLYQYTASISSRMQWMGFPGAPGTGFFTATVRPNPRGRIQIGQFGLKVFYDEIGYTQLKNISVSYGYSVRLKKDLLLNMGMAGNFQSLDYDMTKSNLETIGDPAIYNTRNNEWDFNPDVGMELIGRSFLIGASSQNIFSLLIEENKAQTNTNFLYVMFRSTSGKNVNFQYGIAGILNVDLSQLELKVSTILNRNNRPDLFKLGVAYRTKKEMAFSLGMDLSQLSDGLGNALWLSCRYDYNFSNIRRSSFGTPEVTLVWKYGVLLDCKCQELFK